MAMASRRSKNQRTQPNSSVRGGMGNSGTCMGSKQSWERKELGDGAATVANCIDKMSFAGGEQDRRERRAPVTRSR